METYFTSGWHAGMCLVCKNDTPDDLDKVFDAVTYPNANYQLKIGEGPATRNKDWEGFTLLHFVAFRLNEGMGNTEAGLATHITMTQDAANQYCEVLVDLGTNVGAKDMKGRTASMLDPEKKIPTLHQIKVYDDDFDCSCLSACAVPTNRYDDADGWRDKHTMDNRSMGLAKKDEFSHMGQIS